MRTNLTVSICLFLILSFTGCLPMRTIEGDGNIITKKIDITDYDVFAGAGGKMVINYTQSSEEPGLTIVMDQNIFDIYTFEVENGHLKIKPQKKYEKMYRIRPTEFTITTNSTTIKKFDLAGDAKLNVNSALTSVEKLEISIAGSGNANLPQRAEIGSIKTNLAGSGTVNAAEIICTDYEGEIAGSGTLILGGEAEKVKLSIAGSGEVRAFDLQAKELSSSIAGSGDIEMSVSEKINVDIAGSGKVRYKGNPTEVKKSVAGAGSVKKAEE